MGSGPSRLGSGPSRMGSGSTTRPTSHRRFSSFICGSSSSSSQMEDYAQVSPLISSHENESTLSSKGGTGFTTPTSQQGASSLTTTSSSNRTSLEYESQIESFIDSTCSLDNNHVVPTQVDSLATTDESCKDQILVEATSMIPIGVPNDERERVCTSFEGINEEHEAHDSNSSERVLITSDASAELHSQNDEIMEDMPSSGLDRVQARAQGSLLHVDVVSISSNNLTNVNDDISIREARRNSRRMFWDAFSGRNSTRNSDFPSVFFASDDADVMGSRRRWVLDIGDDLLDDDVDVESWHYGRRNRFTSERRQNSRSEFWDRLRGGANQSTRRTTCPYDLHSDGSCSCDLDEEATFLTSISRIVLLAEALFEVLDEIHRQPDSFSLSMLSIPAPASVVDALPIRTYDKPNSDHGDDADQCYICLVEYEKGDKIRVLPCQHEYHMSCVDKWLKEVHGVCPLCRGDVRGDSASSSSDAHLSLP